jgi:histidine decarboxylase
VVVARRGHVDRVARSVEYVGCMDTTIAGSRNALSPLILWSAIQRRGEDGLRRRAAECLALADYAIERFRAAGIESWRHKSSITVVFPNPGKEVIARWQIAPSGSVAHIITLPHVTRAMIDGVVADVAAALAPSTAVTA